MLDGRNWERQGGGMVFSPAFPVGGIIMWAAPSGTPPDGTWLVTDGTSYLVATFPVLFSVIGYTYGGAGANFNVPNLTNRVAVGSGGSLGGVGASGGELAHTLTIAEMPSHAHDAFGFAYIITGAVGALAAGGPANFQTVANTNAMGGGGSHNNVQPYLAIPHYIKAA